MKTRFFGKTAFVFAFAMLTVARGELASEAGKVKPLGKGDLVPDVILKTASGSEFSLREETKNQPAVILFYRGGWCPYCNRHLAEVQSAEKELIGLGYRVLAISPDRAEALKGTEKKAGVKYTLLSDAGMKATEGFRLGFEVDAGTVEKYKGYGIKLPVTGKGRAWLPVPAVYVVEKGGRIAFGHWDADYSARLSLEKLLEAARAASRD